MDSLIPLSHPRALPLRLTAAAGFAALSWSG